MRANQKVEYELTAQKTIKNPGKFEGEMYYIPIFYEMALDGMADEDTETGWIFDLVNDDFKKYPELKGYDRLELTTDTNGFVFGQVYTMEEVKQA